MRSSLSSWGFSAGCAFSGLSRGAVASLNVRACACLGGMLLRSNVRESSIRATRWLGASSGARFLFVCVCPVVPALYSVSMPSGMMTMSAVPTRTPVPRADVKRNWRCDRARDSGSMPARNDLRSLKSEHGIGLGYQAAKKLTQWPLWCSK